MKISKPSFKITQTMPYEDMLNIVENNSRLCYKSQPKGDPEKFIRKLIKSGHASVLEHVVIGVEIICDRGVSHELVRHRTGIAFSQSSTRYCNYSKEKFGEEITVILPSAYRKGTNRDRYQIWEAEMRTAENAYMGLILLGASAQEARAVLPNSLQTEIAVTANLREWRHIFDLRCSKKAHPDMVYIMCQIRDEFQKKYPVFFEERKNEN